MSGRVAGAIVATTVALFMAAAAIADEAPQVSLPVGEGGSITQVHGDLTAAGLPGVRDGFVAWGDYDADGDQDFLIAGHQGAEIVSRVFRNNGDGGYTAVTACVTANDTTICEGDQSAGVKLTGSTPIHVFVQNITKDITPATGVRGIEVTRTAGASVDLYFTGDGHAIVTQGREAHGALVSSTGGDGAAGGDDWGVIWATGGNGADGVKGGKVDVTNDGAITTNGALAHGLYAYSEGGDGGHGGSAYAGAWAAGGDGGRGGQGGDVDITNDGFITTHGDSALGILAVGQGGNGGGGGNAGATAAEGGNGGGGGLGSLYVTVHNTGGIVTEGIESHGILAQSLGGVGGGGGDGGGIYGGGGGASSSGSAWVSYVQNSGAIQTTGAGSNGIFVQSIGGFGARGGGSGGIVSFGGQGATGGNGGSAYIFNSGGVTTEGANANALIAQSIGGGGGSGAGSGGVYSLGGSGSAGGNGGRAQVQNDGSLSTLGSFASGILVQSIGGGGGNGAGSGGLVSIGGGGSSTGHGGEANVSNSGVITTAGEESQAIMAQSIGGGGGSGAGSGGMVSIGGSGNAGGNGGAVSVSNSGALTTVGLEASAILAQSIGGGGGNGGSSGGIASFGGRGSVTSDGGRVTVLNSGAITTGSGVDTSTTGSQAIFAQSVGGGGGNGGSSGGWFSIGGAGGGGGDASGVAVSNTGSLHTRDNNSSAIFAQSVGGGGGNGGGSGAGGSGMLFTVAIGGSGSRGGVGDTVNVATDVGAIATEGDNSHGILAQSIGGGGGNGGFAVAGSWMTSPVKVAVGGNGGPGGNGGVVAVRSGSNIATSGSDAHGIVAQSVGGGGGTGGFTIAGSFGGGVNYNFAFGGKGGIGGNGGAVYVGTPTDTVHGTISTTGDRSYGIMAQSIGGGGGNGGFAVSGSLLGFASADLAFGGKGGTGGHGDAVSVLSNADIHTSGDISHGIMAQSIGGGGGSGGWSIAGGATGFGGATLALGGGGGPGAKGGTVDVVSGGAIETDGEFSHGILAQSVGGGGGAGGMSGSVTLNFASAIPMPPEIPVTVSSNFAIGIGGSGGTGGTGDSVAVTNKGDIVTHGDFSQGIVAQSIGGGGGAGGKTFAATANVGIPTGPPSPEIKVDFALAVGGSGGSGNHGGAVEVANQGRIDTQGDGSHGILAQSIGGGGGTGGDARAMTVGLDPSEYIGMSNPLEISKTVDIAIGGSGGSSGNGGTVAVTNGGGIVTRGADAYGIMAQSIGGGGGAGGGGYHGLDLSDLGVPENLIPEVQDWGLDLLQEAQIVVGGRGGSSGSGSTIHVNNTGSVVTLGDGSFGILAQSIGGGGGIGGVGALGDGTVGVGGAGGAAGDGGAVQIQSAGNIETMGTAAHAIVAQSIGGGGGIAGNVDRGTQGFGIYLAMGQNGGSAGDGGAVTVGVDGGIVTNGDGANGIFAQSVGGGGGLGGDLGSGYGFAGSAGGNGSGGTVDVRLDGSITTYGSVSHGIVAQSAGGSNDLLPGDRADLGKAVHVAVDGDVTANGADSHGIVAQSVGGDGNGNITVDIESGIVQGGSGSGLGVLILDGADNTLTNHGGITTLQGIAGTAVQGTLGDELIDNFGTITGSIDLGAGTNAFHNEASGVLESGATIDLGTSGILTNEGTLSPGGAENVLTTTVDGSYVQTGSGTYEMTVSGAQNDQLIVADGSVTLDGTLEVVAGHEAYQDGTTYDIIKASDGQEVTGSFSDIVLPKTPFLNFDVQYLDNAIRVSVDVQSFSSAATNPVERVVAGYLDSCLDEASGDMSHLIGSFQVASADQVAQAFAALSPDSYDNLTRGEIQSVHLYENALGQRMNDARSSPWGGTESAKEMSFGERAGWWVYGVRQSGDQDPSNGYLANNFTVSEAMGGYEHAFNTSVLGGSIGTTAADIDRVNETSTGSVNSIIGSLYGGHLWGPAFAQGTLTYANGNFENQRDINVGAVDRTAQGKYDGYSFSAALDGGRKFEAGSWGFEPFAALRYDYLKQNGFTETGAGSANLIVQDRSTNWLTSDLGVRVTTTFMAKSSAFIPELSMSWLHDFDIDERPVVASFEGDPSSSFTLNGQPTNLDGGALGLGLAYHTASGWRASARYDHIQSGDYNANSLSLRLGSQF